jgi:hypothetical protein
MCEKVEEVVQERIERSKMPESSVRMLENCCGPLASSFTRIVEMLSFLYRELIAGTGGSILIIGSASGIALMGLEKN